MKFLTIRKTLLTVTLVTLICPIFSFAQTENLKSALQGVADNLEQLAKLSPSTKNKDREIVELKIRKNAFKNILKLANIESSNLTNKLIKLDNLQDGYLSKRDDFLKSIGNINNYYDSLDKSLDETITLPKIKELAFQFKDWRNIVYHPILQKIVNFLLVFEGQDVLQTTEKRYESVSVDLKKVSGLGVIKDSPLSNLLDQAEKSLDKARDLQKAASLIILKSNENNTQELIEEELVKIREVYNKFLEMSNWLKQASKK